MKWNGTPQYGQLEMLAFGVPHFTLERQKVTVPQWFHWGAVPVVPAKSFHGTVEKFWRYNRST
jgi:hypothetical protein